MRLLTVFSLLFFLTSSPQAWAQAEEADSASTEIVLYVVRPGDTLQDLSARYLGSKDLWTENWKLNKDGIEDPHRIFPGQQIKLLLPRKVPADGALLNQVANRVEDQPTPLSWNESRENELLRPRDGIRTYEGASADLIFPDDTHMLVTEKSTVFLGDKSPAHEAVDRTQIEIVVGQADFEGSSASADSSQFEIVLGDAKATPKASGNKAMQTRARRTDGGAQLMVYSGESALAAAGKELTVGTGMGSSVAQGKAPTPPEKLLSAAVGRVPKADAQLATPRPTFRWQPVDGARSYTVEVCRDPRCGALVRRVQALKEPSWKAKNLPVEKLYWRVTAVSASGLDGYPSTTQGLTILSAVEDKAPPEIRVTFVGPQRMAPRSGLNESWIVGPGMEIEVEVEDSGSGVEAWEPMIDGETIPREALKGPWKDGEHTVRIVATDRAGNRGETEIPFIFDSEPPAVSWGVEGTSASGSSSGEPSESPVGSAPTQRGRREIRLGKLSWEVDSDLAQIRLRPQTGKPIGLEGLGSVNWDKGLWLLADDKVCSDLKTLAYELTTGDRRQDLILRYVATDCVGNSRYGHLPLVRQKRGK